MKPNVVKIVSIVGTVLSVGGSLLSAWAGNKQTEETIAKKVAEQLEKTK